SLTFASHLFNVEANSAIFDVVTDQGFDVPFKVRENAYLSSVDTRGDGLVHSEVLSRHGARYPTPHKGEKYAELIDRIQNQTELSKLGPGYQFLETFEYDLKTSSLVEFGKRQLAESGIAFYERYEHLTRTNAPFVRASVSSRVVESAEMFMKGFAQSRKEANGKPVKIDVDVIMYEGAGFNSTLDTGSCPAFEIEKEKDNQEWTDPFLTKHFGETLQRVKQNLPGAEIELQEIIYLMDLCAFHTVTATPDASRLSPFCGLFTNEEWKAYDYLSSLTKYYNYGNGNKLAPSNGIGFVNELIARLTKRPVHDETSVNHTLDSDPKTFPLGMPLYTDFSHDNEMEPIYAVLGVPGPALDKGDVKDPKEIDYFTSSRLIPFAARMYVEKMQCGSEKEEYVRILINDRVMPIEGCSVDDLGRCKLSDFVSSLTYATSGGDWDLCFI
ncbi:hypothetical protein KEM56_000724, partial [Ascosphaera pollenicola]